MNARSVTLNVLVVALLGGCAAAPVQEEEQEPLGLRIFMGVTEFLVTTAFDAAFSAGEKHDKHHQRSNSSAHSATPSSYASAPAHTTQTKPMPVSLKGVQQ
jgi:hypothetical protein